MDRHNGHPRAITEVSIDMSPAYVAGVKENLGDPAVIVFDKFHVIAHVNQAVDETRKAERRQVDQADAAYLKASKWVLLKTRRTIPKNKRRTIRACSSAISPR